MRHACLLMFLTTFYPFHGLSLHVCEIYLWLNGSMKNVKCSAICRYETAFLAKDLEMCAMQMWS